LVKTPPSKTGDPQRKRANRFNSWSQGERKKVSQDQAKPEVVASIGQKASVGMKDPRRGAARASDPGETVWVREGEAWVGHDGRWKREERGGGEGGQACRKRRKKKRGEKKVKKRKNGTAERGGSADKFRDSCRELIDHGGRSGLKGMGEEGSRAPFQ